ncbi:glutamate-5-semialdehyde dehydrogenase [Arcticibacter sp.]|uniref:glutamate-5-semialdehyde dehydrogenase n=1 Tax=Arcticibacter sp. TaxID=1872630 RepID=UPI00388D9E4C
MEYKEYFEKAVKASHALVKLTDNTIKQVLYDVAEALVGATDALIEANKLDLARMDPEDPKYDRLLLTPDRISSIAGDMKKVAGLATPVGTVLSEHDAENGMHISKVSVPLGVVGVIYEARPNVTADVFALCFRTGNVAVLKGGSDADDSNRAVIAVIHQVLERHGITPEVALLLPAERAATEALLNAYGYVDVLIPRGSQQLIDYVRLNSKIPVIETGAGIVHTYFDAAGDPEKGKAIIFNSKTRRVSVCNALDCLLIHESRLEELPDLLEPLVKSDVEVFADEKTYDILEGKYPANLLHQAQPEHFGTEFLSYKMAVKSVPDFDAALSHINAYSSKHSEAIVSENPVTIESFLNQVDAAAVYANVSTAFTDGAQFGLGAEIGISTQKLHARGPMGLAELTTYKWIVRGNGQTRS